MKKVFTFLVVLCLFSACSERDVSLYDSNVSYVQFVDSYVDSTNISFLLYPTEESHKFPLVLKLAGLPLQEDTPFKLVVHKMSTAQEQDYVLPDEIVFRANRAVDTLMLTLNKTAKLEDTPVRLVLEIQGEGSLLAGQTFYTRKIIWLSNTISQPKWWDAAFVRSMLGVYTDKKFTEFIRITGTGELAGMEPDRVRALCLKFKAELVRLRNAGTPMLEENGTDMLSTIPLLG